MNRFTSSLRIAARGLTLLGALLLAATATVHAGPLPVAAPLGAIADDLHAPSRVATDASGWVYVTDPEAGVVRVTDAFGRMITNVEGLARPLAIAVDATGNIYLAEAAAGRVTVFDPQWHPLAMLGAGNGEFLLPNHIALGTGASGPVVYVADSKAHQVKVYENHTLVRTLGGLGKANGKFDFPTGLRVNAAGELFVADQNNDRISVFNASGTWLRNLALNPPGTAGRSGRAQGLTGDSLGRLYVADAYQGYVKVLDESGAFLGILSGHGSATGRLRVPGGLALDGLGRLFVTSSDNQRVEVFGLDCAAQLTATPSAQVAAAGGTVTFTITPLCGGSWTYQWQKNGVDLAEGGTISGTTNATLSLAGITPGDAGAYRVVASGPGGLMTSPAAQLIVATVPVVVTGPASQSVKQGNPVNFYVTATGEALTYQWSFNGSAIAGATSSSLSLTNVQPVAAGSYAVSVANPAGTVSRTAALTVLEPPTIVLGPISQTVAEGASVSFSGMASGAIPLTYRWLRNGALISGALTNTLSLTNVTPAANGAYQLVVINPYGLTTSSVANLVVTPDTVAPVALLADSGRTTNRTIVVAFSKPLNLAKAQTLANYELTGPGGLSILSAVLANGTNVTLTLNAPRPELGNYSLLIRDLTDTAYTPNTLNPNPTTLTVLGTIQLVGINSTSWKFLQTTNATGLDGQAWYQPAYNASAWSNGFGIFYGNRTNSVYQPNPNPNVVLPFSLSTSDPANTKVYTILNVFTNAGNLIQETTYYFRTTFNFPARTNGATLLLHAMVDDGAVYYLNGREVRRDRMPTGTITASTLASSSGSQSWSPALTAAGNPVALTNLVTGTNTLAIELHQRTTTDTDITLGIWLEASVATFVAPAPTAPGDFRLAPLARSGDAQDLTLTWDETQFALEAAANLSGPWTPVIGSSPLALPKATLDQAPQQFFRLRALRRSSAPAALAPDQPATTAW